MTPAEALQRIYSLGLECWECRFKYREHNADSRSFERGCILVDDEDRDPFECPGVEPMLRKDDPRL